jgi:hypothetical protein
MMVAHLALEQVGEDLVATLHVDGGTTVLVVPSQYRMLRS